MGMYYRCLCGEMAWIIGDGIITCTHCRKEYRMKEPWHPEFFNENTKDLLINKYKKLEVFKYYKI